MSPLMHSLFILDQSDAISRFYIISTFLLSLSPFDIYVSYCW
jgi:hypothetical protein